LAIPADITKRLTIVSNERLKAIANCDTETGMEAILMAAECLDSREQNAELLQKVQQLEVTLDEAREVARYIMESDTGDGGYMRIISSDIADKLRRIAGVE
jgi:hypothetical protein